jgi:protein-S-isoprenylcysteine O-methyltransferase Ste14
VNISWLETKVPPPLVAVLTAIGMWALRKQSPAPDTAPMGDGRIATVIAVVGVAIAVSGVLAFRRAHTTTNPVHPGRASSLVRSGSYRITRNPMYLGVTIVLTAWAFFLGSALTMIGPIFFIAYISVFQIAAEERVLLGIFGEDYRAYTRAVRRWI